MKSDFSKADLVRKYLAKRTHVVLSDAEMDSTWCRLKTQLTHRYVVAFIVIVTICGALAAAFIAKIIGDFGTLPSGALAQSIYQFAPQIGAAIAIPFGWWLCPSLLAPLDPADLAAVSECVQEEPLLFSWVIHAVQQGKTLRYRDYLAVDRWYSVLKAAEAKDKSKQSDEITHGTALARILAAQANGSATGIEGQGVRHKAIYSLLDPCSPPVTSPEVVEWVEAVAEAIKHSLGSDNVWFRQPSCCIWAYRHYRTEYIVAEFSHEGSGPDCTYTVSFGLACSPQRRFSLDEPSVPDAAEALHCIGLIVNKLGSSITMDMWQRKAEKPNHELITEMIDRSFGDIDDDESIDTDELHPFLWPNDGDNPSVSNDRRKLGEVTITKIHEPRGELPEIAHVAYTFTGDLSEDLILMVTSKEEHSITGSNGTFDSNEKRGGYALIDEKSRLTVGQVLPVFHLVDDYAPEDHSDE